MKTQYLISALAVAASASTTSLRTRGAACNGSNYAFANSFCTTTCGQDMPGGDYNSAQVDSFESCVDLCGNDPICLTAQYHEDTSYCYLKNAINTYISASGEDSTTCVQNVCGTTQTINGQQCTFQCLKDRHGGDIGNQYTGSLAACGTACANYSGCVTAQFNHGNGYCYFKGSSNALDDSNNTDTVDCSPASTSP